MSKTADFLAVDLGASSGRVMLGSWDGRRFTLSELHRFANGPVHVLGHMYWDVLRLWQEIIIGLQRYASQYGGAPAGISVDTWGVDFGLLDRRGRLLGNPYHYRDARTEGVPAQVFQHLPFSRIFNVTGIQFMPINTLYQLAGMVYADDPQVAAADMLLMMPDLFHYWLTGRKAGEYTIASTSQMLDALHRCWADDLLKELGLPTGLLPPLVPPGTVLGDLLPGVMAEAGFQRPVPVIAAGSHDTASAVAAIPDLDVHSVYISSGTWSLMGVEVPQPILTEQARVANLTNEGGVGDTIRLLKNISGLWLLQESRRHWQRTGHDYTWDDLLTLAEQAEPFCCLVDPDAAEFLNPPDMPAAIRSFCCRAGQPEPDSVGAVVRCCLESLALRYRWVLLHLEEVTGRRLETIRIVGGGSQNRLLSQWAADACERPVITGPVEATALGNIMVQAVATGHLADIAAGRAAVAASIQRRTYEPHPSAAWQDAFARFCALA